MVRMKVIFKAFIAIILKFGYNASIMFSVYLLLSGGNPLTAVFSLLVAVVFGSELRAKELENRVLHLESLLLEDMCFDTTQQISDSQELKSETKDPSDSQ